MKSLSIKKIKISIGLSIFLAIPVIIHAGQGSAGAKFLQINPGARGTANGGSLIARPGLLEAVYYNPASLAQLANLQVFASHLDYLVGMSFDQISFAYPSSMGTLSGAILGMFSGEMEETTEESPMGTGRYFTANDLAAQLSYARNFTNKFSGGITVKYIYQSLDKLHADGLAVDMGAIYQTGILHNLIIGFALKNFGGDLQYTGENLQRQIGLTGNVFEEEDVRIEIQSEKYSLPIQFELGLSFQTQIAGFGELLPSVTMHNIVDQSEFFSMGAEYRYQDFLYVAIGHGNLNSLINPGLNNEDLGGNMRGLTGGLGINLLPVLGQHTWLTYSFESHKYFNPIHSFGISLEF